MEGGQIVKIGFFQSTFIQKKCRGGPEGPPLFLAGLQHWLEACATIFCKVAGTEARHSKRKITKGRADGPPFIGA